MDLKGYCYSLSKNELFALAIKMCDAALPIWTAYSLSNNLEYRDTVVGLSHKVRPHLLSDTIKHCRSINLSNFDEPEHEKLLSEFSDPIAALQDDDWKLPDAEELIFYGVYNLIGGVVKSYSVFGELIHYVAVNQSANALDASQLMSIEEIRKIIYG